MRRNEFVFCLCALMMSACADPDSIKVDFCPNDPAKDKPGACGCGLPDNDLNNDGIVDCLEKHNGEQVDYCLDDPNKELPGVCGCGVSDADTTGNGVPDCLDEKVDLCPNDPEKKLPGVCGCDVSDADTTGSGLPDCLDEKIDLCPGDPEKKLPGVCGCGVSDEDTDGNGVPDCLDKEGGDDLCPGNPNKTEPGICGCDVLDVDTDGDGLVDCKDQCPKNDQKILPGICGCDAEDTPENFADSDGDGVINCLDVCPENPTKSKDAGAGGCDVLDSDRDGVDDSVDACPFNGSIKDVADPAKPVDCNVDDKSILHIYQAKDLEMMRAELEKRANSGEVGSVCNTSTYKATCESETVQKFCMPIMEKLDMGSDLGNLGVIILDTCGSCKEVGVLPVVMKPTKLTPRALDFTTCEDGDPDVCSEGTAYTCVDGMYEPTECKSGTCNAEGTACAEPFCPDLKAPYCKADVLILSCDEATTVEISAKDNEACVDDIYYSGCEAGKPVANICKFGCGLSGCNECDESYVSSCADGVVKSCVKGKITETTCSTGFVCSEDGTKCVDPSACDPEKFVPFCNDEATQRITCVDNKMASDVCTFGCFEGVCNECEPGDATIKQTCVDESTLRTGCSEDGKFMTKVCEFGCNSKKNECFECDPDVAKLEPVCNEDGTGIIVGCSADGTYVVEKCSHGCSAGVCLDFVVECNDDKYNDYIPKAEPYRVVLENDIDLGDYLETEVVDGQCMAKHWDSLPMMSSVNFTGTLDKDGNAPRITFTKDGKRCALPESFMNWLVSSEVSNIAFDFDVTTSKSHAAVMKGIVSSMLTNVSWSGAFKQVGMNFDMSGETELINAGITPFVYGVPNDPSGKIVKNKLTDVYVDGGSITASMGYVSGIAAFMQDTVLTTGTHTNRIDRIEGLVGGGIALVTAQSEVKSSSNEIGTMVVDSFGGGAFAVLRQDKDSSIKDIKNKVGNMLCSGQSSLGYDVCGGFVGIDEDLDLENIQNEVGNITGNNIVGGFAGAVGRSSFINIVNSVQSVRGNKYVAGLAGQLASSVVMGITNDVDQIIGTEYVGGFVGAFTGSNEIDAMQIENKVGSVSGASAGGFAGSIDNAGLSYINSSVKNVGSILQLTSVVGGFAGSISNTLVDHVSSTVGTVMGEEAVGGFVGNTMLLANIGFMKPAEDIVVFSDIANQVTDSVVGKNSVGGFIGSASVEVSATGATIPERAPSFIYRNIRSVVERVEGNTPVGGFFGYHALSLSYSPSASSASSSMILHEMVNYQNIVSVANAFTLGTGAVDVAFGGVAGDSRAFYYLSKGKTLAGLEDEDPSMIGLNNFVSYANLYTCSVYDLRLDLDNCTPYHENLMYPRAWLSALQTDSESASFSVASTNMYLHNTLKDGEASACKDSSCNYVEWINEGTVDTLNAFCSEEKLPVTWKDQEVTLLGNKVTVPMFDIDMKVPE